MKSDIQLNVINIVRELRNDNDLSQAGFADIIGVSYGMIGNIESTKFNHKYTIEQLQKATQFFSFPFERLFMSEIEASKNKREVIDLLIERIKTYDR
ncbi:helix-turn-helix transcriptional regulator [Olleya marilimosa]|uniref:helix-turn-helix transcriptional regulator n=1 Tax=Olleya marilimosa TaxID=272164 RepID=UPI000488B6C2|nr:helix-turn-helix transcriptional regulator [Olleya marilimosa]